MGRPLSVLIVEDSEDDELLLLMCLRQAGFEPKYERVQTCAAMSNALESKAWELVISDHNMPSFSAPEALQLLRSKGYDLPFIIVSGSIGEEAAVRAMKAGAQDYLVKGHLARLPAAIERELKDAEERRARKAAEEKVRTLAYFDPLTGLPNRANLCEQLAASLSGPTPALAVVAIKVDNLRELNNTLGFATGERVLMALAERLKLEIDPPRWVARTAGAEFAVVLPNADARMATDAAAELQRIVSETVTLDELEVDVRASVGVALSPDHADDPEHLLQRTNVALSQAPETHQRVVLYDHHRDPYQPQRLSLITELRRAIDGDELRLYYQPKVRLDAGAFVGVEALIRWKHPKLGMISPDQFIPLAEQTGLIHPMTRWVLTEALRQSAAWQRTGIDANVAVNVSAKNLHSSDLAEHLARVLSASGATAEKLIVEVTESAIMDDESRAQKTLNQLHDQGAEIAIDDFGTGYSSFANLRRLPVTEIKIDKSFVIGMAESNEDRIIVDSIVELGHKLGMQVVAEGIETLSAWNVLSELRCDLAQGYYLSRPLPADDLPAWIRAFVPPGRRANICSDTV